MKTLEGTAETSYLRRLELENVRAFNHFELELGTVAEPPEMLAIVIGRNGTCKTTLLRSIALGLAAEEDAAALVALPNGRWITEGRDRGSIKLWLEPTEGGPLRERKLELRAGSRGDTLSFAGDLPEPRGQVFLCAYGLGRGNLGGEPGRGYRVMDSVATLFRYEERLVHGELVLRRLRDYLGTETFDATLLKMKCALGLDAEHRIELPAGGGVEISGPGIGESIPLEGWADGYRMTLSWMIDFYGWAMRAQAIDREGDIRGILLIDELEQHLHPALQSELLGRLRTALPKVQILVTTHSPLVALATPSEQIVALHRKGLEISRATVPDLTAYSAEDVLVEEALFGTEAHAPATQRKLSRHHQLKRIPKSRRSAAEVAELRQLAGSLRADALPALRDDPVVTKLDELAALLEAQSSER